MLGLAALKTSRSDATESETPPPGSRTHLSLAQTISRLSNLGVVSHGRRGKEAEFTVLVRSEPLDGCLWRPHTQTFRARNRGLHWAAPLRRPSSVCRSSS